jgi:large subunit ribosomal protein L24
MQRIKQDDEVVVIAGKDKGWRGKVVKVFPNGRLVVEGVNIARKHQRPNPQAGVAGGIVEKEKSIDPSNVMLFNNAANKGERVGFKTLENGRKVRTFRSSGEVVDA